MRKTLAYAVCLSILAGSIAVSTFAEEREKLVYKATKLSASDVMVTCRNGAEVQVKRVSEKIYILSCEN